MFNNNDIELLKQSPYKVILANHHDVTIHSDKSGHDWIIVSNYDRPNCYILHRHSPRDSYHRQEGTYKSLEDALGYINRHEKWFLDN